MRSGRRIQGGTTVPFPVVSMMGALLLLLAGGLALGLMVSGGGDNDAEAEDDGDDNATA